MSDEKKTTTITDAAAQAEQLEKEAQAQKGLYTYTHVFQEPFTYQGMTYEKLTFNWKTLSGKDSAAIERELLNRNVTTVVAEFTPEYLTAMAARACPAMARRRCGYELPLPEFRAICLAARSFLLRSGSRRATAAAGSESNA